MHHLSYLILCVLLLSKFPMLTQADTITVVDKSLINVDVHVEYMWDATQSDLDTATVFLGQKAGFNCPAPSPSATNYIVFSGDRTGSGGTEHATVLVSKAAKDGKTTNKEIILLYAHWHRRDANGAKINVLATLRDSTTGQNIKTFPITIEPENVHRGCSALFPEALKATVIIEEIVGGVKYTLTEGGDHDDKNQEFAIGGCRGDPHCDTFDNLKYDCQGTGEFILSKIPDIGFEAQVRHGERLFDKVTLTTGFAIIIQKPEYGLNLPLVQVSISEDTKAHKIGNCHVKLFVGRVEKDLSYGFDDNDVKVVLKNVKNIVVSYVSFDISMHVSVREWNGRCFLEGMRLQVPVSFFQGTEEKPIKAIGLLGSFTGESKDDWTTKDGTPIEPPKNRDEQLYKRAYDYCVQTWCNRDASKSLFEYEGGSHADYDKCDLPFGKKTDLSNVANNIKDVCGDDLPCQVEGVLGGPAIALEFKRAITEIKDIEKNANALFVDPKSIRSLRLTKVKIAVDISAKTGTEAANIESFAVYTINADTTGIISYKGRIFHDESTQNSDITGDGKRFSYTFRFFSIRGDTSFSLRIIPVIKNVEQPNSNLVFTALNIIDVV